jgi:hypothetical protein
LSSSMTCGQNSPGVFLLTGDPTDQVILAILAQQRNGQERPRSGPQQHVPERL